MKYLCDDGNCEIEINADSAREAAQEYAEAGDWGEIESTIWIDVRVIECVCGPKTDPYRPLADAGDDPLTGGWCNGDGPDEDGASPCEANHERGAKDIADHSCDGCGDYTPTRETVGEENLCSDCAEGCTCPRDSHLCAINPEEPDCTSDDGEHKWESPHDIVGGCEENPGVHGQGGGVAIHTVCAHCGTHRHEDTWARNPETGQQGLYSVRYEIGDESTEEMSLRIEAEAELRA